MAAAQNIVVSDCLCFLLHKYNKVGLKQLKSILSDFYSSDELSDAKDKLFNIIDNLKLTFQPKVPRNRRVSTGNSHMDIEDLVLMTTFIDENKLTDKMPLVVATNPDKLPSIRLLERDLEVILNKMDKLENSVKDINNCCVSIADMIKSFMDNFSRTESSISTVSSIVYSVQDKLVNLDVNMESIKSAYSALDSNVTEMKNRQINNDKLCNRVNDCFVDPMDETLRNNSAIHHHADSDAFEHSLPAQGCKVEQEL